MKRHSKEDAIAMCGIVRFLVEGGMTTKAACRAIGVTVGRHIEWRRKYGVGEVRIWAPLSKRNLAKRVSVNDRGCWILKRKPATSHVMYFRGRVRSAAKAVWMLYRGRIPKGLFVCHRCDDRACVNPEHLFLGTPLENMRDMVSKGRHAPGSKHPNAKLTESQVVEILQRAGESSPALARAFGVSAACIRHIQKRKSWKHVALNQQAA